MGDLSELIPQTQDKLSGLFTKPKLSEKLLSKPPFRFLHDVVSAVTASTGFSEGLFAGEELDSGNLKDKATKMAYLDKIICLVGICQGQELAVRSAKVVAGLEPEHTNVWLAALGQSAVDDQLDRAEAVRLALSDVRPGEVPPPRQGGGGGAEAKDSRGDRDRDRASSEGKDAPSQPEVEQQSKGLAPPQSRRGSSRAGRRSSAGSSASAAAMQEAKSAAEDMGMGMDMGIGRADGKDLTAAIEGCTGDVAVTKEMIERIISKPRMSEKLLSKPPFRFLHDIISEVTRVTGFAEGLYNQDLIDSSKVKDKGSKIAYLELAIKLVGTQLNTLVDARPAKIVAGLEAENTNRFLQLLALAAVELPDTRAVVGQIVDGTEGNAPAAVSRQSSQDSSSGQRRSSVSSERKSPEVERKEEELQEKPATTAAEPAPRTSLVQEAKQPAGVEEGKEEPQSKPQPQLAEVAEQKRSMRPTTARRRPPTVKDNVKEVEGKRGSITSLCDAKATPKVAIMKEHEGSDSEEDEVPEEEDGGHVGMPGPVPTGAGGAHTSIVRDIIEEQQKEAAAKKEADAGEENEKKEGGGIKLGKLRKSGQPAAANALGGKRGSVGAMSDGDVEALRATIQVLCQSTNPLGKCMDYVHEDLAMMGSELDKWQAEYKRKTETLVEEKRSTQDALEPLRVQLLELEEQVKEGIMRINSVKAKIAGNSTRIRCVK
ncbi:unnamed protein product [Chrysoparadoxa australica]